jgi:hypothetical protein
MFVSIAFVSCDLKQETSFYYNTKILINVYERENNSFENKILLG